MSEETRSDEAREHVPEELRDRLDELGERLVVEGEPEKEDHKREPERADETQPGDRY